MTKKKILIVDDEPDLVYAIQLMLEKVGYEIFTATNGQEGLEVAQKEQLDLIISDVLMPQMDGFAFYKELKKDKKTSDIPILILTVRGQMEDTFKVMGVDEFLIKPFEGHGLLSKVTKLLSRQRPFPIVEGPSQKILVAGRSQEVLETMFQQLKSHHYEVEMAFSSADVIIKCCVFDPQMIIMETQMEDISAEEAIRIIRLLPPYQKVPILLYSCLKEVDLEYDGLYKQTLTIEQSKKNCLREGATKYMGKYNELNLVESIVKYIKTKEKT